MPDTADVSLRVRVEALALPRFDRRLEVSVREARLLSVVPWVRSLGKLPLEVSTVGWRFPAPPSEAVPRPKLHEPDASSPPSEAALDSPTEKKRTRLKPPGDMVVFKDRLLYLLQPP